LLSTFDAMDAAKAMIHPIYNQHPTQKTPRESINMNPRRIWEEERGRRTTAIEIVVMKNGSPIMYPVVH